MPLKINPKFKTLIPPLAPEEFAQLEANIVGDGCRDPLVVWGGVLIDGHNRFDICQRHKIKFELRHVTFTDESAACVWIIRNQFGRRNLAPFTRVELALKLEPLLREKAAKNQATGKSGKGKPLSADLHKADTLEALGKTSGVSRRTIADGKLIDRHADEATKEKLRTNQKSIHAVAKEIKERIQSETRREKRLEAAGETEIDSRIVVGDFRTRGDEVKDGSVNLIFTDPPYDRKASLMLPSLASFAASKLCDGGSLICYVGQTQLPAALDALRLHLRYWWTIACIHSGGSTEMREYGVKAGWKAVLWFVKGSRDNSSVFVSDVMSGGKEKAAHDWQQSQSEAEYWIEKLCPADGLVCDPFLGGGTTAAAAKAKGRKWIGFEIDEANAKIASGRIEK